MTYIEFDQKITDLELADINESFLKDLGKLKDSDENCKLLLSILDSYLFKHAKKVKFNESLGIKYFKSSGLDGVILVVISGNSDKLLIKLAIDYQFPRGFPIIYVPNKSIHMYGFYPKFDNDDRQDVIENSEEFRNMSHLTFNYKYSGFLGQLVPFKYNEQYYYTTCSKNSTGNKFSKELHRIIKDKCNLEVIQSLVDNNLHICGETMSKYDQVHGSKVLEDSFIVTMIAVGHCVNFSYITDVDVDTSASASATASASELSAVSISGHTYLPSDKSLIKFLNGADVLKTSLQYGFSVDNIFTINDSEKSILFLQTLSKDRNYLNLTRFQEIISELGSVVQIQSGNFNHATALGDVLEGIIIKIVYNDDNKRTLKLKFPYYTLRTMFLRNTFFNLSNDMSDINLNYINSLGRIISTNPCDGSEYKNAITKFVGQWVINDGVGKLYYNLVCNLLCENLQSWCTDYINKYTAFIESYTSNAPLYSEGKDASDIGYPFYAFHIYAIDRLFTELFPDINTFEKAKGVLNQHDIDIPDILSSVRASAPVNIIFVFGAIGTGKTTFGTKLQTLIGDTAIHIDGDILDLEVSDNVYALGEERNPYTIWKMIEAMILNGKLPIITTGGGVFSSYNIFKEFGTMLKNVNLEFNISAYISSDFREITHFDNKSDFNSILDSHVSSVYFDKDRLLNCIVYRRWVTAEKDPKFEQIRKNNEGNFDIVKKLLSSYNVNNLYLFPAINNPSEMVEFDMSKVSVNTNNIEMRMFADLACFGQKRILVSYREQNSTNKLKFHHITARFDNEKNIHYAGEQIFNENTNAVYYKLVPEKIGADKPTAPIELIVVNNEELNGIEPDLNTRSHITVSARPHVPSDMMKVAIAIKRGDPSVSLTYKPKPTESKTCIYNISPLSTGSISIPIDVTLWNVFYIT